LISSKARGAVNAALDEVLRDTCHIDTGLPSHSEISRNNVVL
jgi:hypothetical protein